MSVTIFLPEKEEIPGLYVSYYQVSGYLNPDNIDGFAQWMRSVLLPNGEPKPYTWVAVNEFFGYKPEVRVNQYVTPESTRDGEGVKIYDGDLPGFSVADTYGVWDIHVSERDRIKGYNNPEPKFATYVEAEYRNGWNVTFRHRAPAGYRLFWTIAMQEENNDAG